MLVLILLCFALACFGLGAFPNSGVTLNLDAAGKAFLVGAVIAHMF